MSTKYKLPMNKFLNQPIQNLNMIGEVYAKRLAKLDIHRVIDLLHHYPFHYEDRSSIKPLDQLQVGETVTLNGTIISITSRPTSTGKTIQQAIFADDSGTIKVSWFNQPYLVKTLQKNPDISLSGTIHTFRGQPTLSSPQFELLKTGDAGVHTTIHTGRLVPRYHQTAGVSSKWLRSRIKSLLKDSIDIPDPIPVEIANEYDLIDLKTALQNIHFPPDYVSLNQAINRLKFDELLTLQLSAQLRKSKWQEKQTGHSFQIKTSDVDHIIRSLPFTLTQAQKNSLDQIIHDLKTPQPMNRLLQGDVGAGKTVVAAIAMYLSAKNNLTSILMAPTEVLALQHARSISQILKPLDISISVQTRSRKDKVKNPQVYIGTHALLHRKIVGTTGLVVIDEQHRFGVRQRAKLLDSPVSPHLLSMTATPIPRTIALTLYADLEVSVIDELPPGRKPVKTWLVPPKKRTGAYQWISDKVKNSQDQVFVVCPLIEDSETPMLDQVKAAESEYKRLKTKIFPQFRMGLLHGRLKSKEKTTIINQFADGKLDILVATPVIEVGIDIPNASIILIEAAERFGLASLHQLRGRVGRGDKESYCLLFTSSGKPSGRLKHLETTHSGFKLAELDLKLRGAGEIYGTKQSGHINLRIASLSDSQLISQTHQAASKLIKKDPQLDSHPLLKQEVKSLLEKDVQPN